jgi:hypothetical protein
MVFSPWRARMVRERQGNNDDRCSIAAEGEEGNRAGTPEFTAEAQRTQRGALGRRRPERKGE